MVDHHLAYRQFTVGVDLLTCVYVVVGVWCRPSQECVPHVIPSTEASKWIAVGIAASWIMFFLVPVHWQHATNTCLLDTLNQYASIVR